MTNSYGQVRSESNDFENIRNVTKLVIKVHL